MKHTSLHLTIIMASLLSATMVSAQTSTQLLDSTVWITALLPSKYRPVDSSLVPFTKSDTCYYYETAPQWYIPMQAKNWYWESGTYWNSTAGTSSSRWYARRTPLGLIGRATGATANFRIDIPAAGKYVVYAYMCNTFGAGDNAYFTVRKGSGAPDDTMQRAILLDSLRYSLLQPGENVPAFINLGLIKGFINQTADGAWLPMTIVDAPAGSKVVTVTIGADTLTNGPLRVDAVRILRSNETADLEFGRRPRLTFSSARVPEMFPATPVGNKKNRRFTLFNIGSATLTVAGITSANNQFSCSNSFPFTIESGHIATIEIAFAPTKIGTVVDTLVISSNDSREPTAHWYMVGTGESPNYLTIDQTAGLQSGSGMFQPMGIDTNYYETPPAAFMNGTANPGGNDGLYNNTGTSCWGGTNRVAPNAAGGGSPSGASGNYVFDVPVSAPYLVYAYLLSSVNNTDHHLLTVKRSGETTIADSVRFDSRTIGDNVTNFINRGLLQSSDSIWSAALGKYVLNPNQDGAWMPLTCVPMFQGKKTTVTWSADALTPAYFRFDAVRILRGDADRCLQYGRREKNGFLGSRRVPEMFPLTMTDDSSVREFKFWSLGKYPVTLQNISGTSGRFVCTTPMPVTIEQGKFAVINIQFRPYQEEEEITDTLTIRSDDSNEPTARWIAIGQGINYYFILNASAGGIEPHFNAPGSPSSKGYSGPPYFNPIYEEKPAGWINSAINAVFVYPIPDGNKYSRVYSATGPAECSFKFMLPPQKSGTYILEYNGPAASSSAFQLANVDVVTPFRSDTQRVIGFNQRMTAGSMFTPIDTGRFSGSGYRFGLNGGDTTTIRFSAITTDAIFLRMDLLRVHKVPYPSGIQKDLGALPTEYRLGQNYPNPFNPSTVVEFALPQTSQVSLVVYDILGREVRRLIDGVQKEAGYYRVHWNSQNGVGVAAASGVYLYRITAGKFVDTKKMLLVR